MNQKYTATIEVILKIDAMNINTALDKVEDVITNHAEKWWGCEVTCIEREDDS